MGHKPQHPPEGIVGVPWLEEHDLPHPFPFRLIRSRMNTFSRHWHDAMEIFYLKRGAISLYLRGRWYRLASRDIVLIPAGEVHAYDSRGERNSSRVILFHLNLLDNDAADYQRMISLRALFASNEMLYAAGRSPVHPILERHILTITEEERKRPPGYSMAIRARMYDIYLTLLRNASFVGGEIPRSDDTRLAAVFLFVERHYRDPICIADAAAAAHLSKYHFSRLFKTATGRTFLDFLHEYRIGVAKHLLVERDRTVDSVSIDSGFSNAQTFYRVFKQRVGMSPSAYRTALYETSSA